LGVEHSQAVPEAGAFHLQQIQPVSTVRLERRLGALTADEMQQVRKTLGSRLGI
jgi:mRNA-degrading endonuclease toxin of MazEF toxin-antitoxin module